MCHAQRNTIWFCFHYCIQSVSRLGLGHTKRMIWNMGKRKEKKVGKSGKGKSVQGRLAVSSLVSYDKLKPSVYKRDLTWKKKRLYKALHFWYFPSCSTWFNHIAHIYMSNQKSKYFIGFYMIRSLRSQLYESLVISCLMSSEMPGESKMYNLLERNNSLLLCFHSCMYMSLRAS